MTTTLIFATDELEEEIKKEKEKQEESDAEAREMRKKNREQQKNMGGASASSEHTQQTGKNIRTLENRLDQVRAWAAAAFHFSILMLLPWQPINNG